MDKFYLSYLDYSIYIEKKSLTRSKRRTGVKQY